MKTCFFRSVSTGLAAAVIGFVLAGCATQRPVLYPNAKYKQAGSEIAQQHIDDCLRLAEQSGASHGGGEGVARGGAQGAVVGGVAGAAAGAVTGNIGQRAAEGAAAGAAAAATYGAFRSGEPSPVYKGFVQRCLSERGYEVIGWQ